MSVLVRGPSRATHQTATRRRVLSTMDVSISHPADSANFSRVDIGDFTLYFSYSTIVAFRSPATGLVCSENQWSQTTGKHLSFIQPNKARRVSAEQFEQEKASFLARIVAV